MGVPISEVGYTPAMPRREDHEVHKGYVVALGKGGNFRPIMPPSGPYYEHKETELRPVQGLHLYIW